MRRARGRAVRWALAASLGLLALAARAEEVVDNKDTFWDERLMPVIKPYIEASKTWAPPETVDWTDARLDPAEPLAPAGTKLNLDPARLNKLLDALDLDRPGLEAVRTARTTGDLDAAGLALAEHYRARPWPDTVLPEPLPVNGLNTVIVELAMLDIFTQGMVFGRQPRTANGLLDWNHQGPRNDPEWSWWLNRMGYLPQAVSLWEITGDRRFARLANDHLADWVRANPYPGIRSYSAPWRPLEVARRIDTSWLDALARLQDSPDFSVESRLLVLSSLPDHADALLHFPSFSGNHLLTEKVMLAQLAVAFPEFRDAPRWLADAVATVDGLLDRQVYPDGAYEELTNHYQLVALDSFQRFLELVASSGDAVHTARVKPTVEHLWNYFAYVMKPDGSGLLNNDSDWQDNRAELTRALDWFDRADWVYLATEGREGEEPAGPPTRFFPWAGHAIMRDGWSPHSQWAFFDLGPYGSDHQHNDRLHLSVSFGGKNFLVDSGRYDYTPGTTRDYFRGPHGHNVVLLDDTPPLPGPAKVTAPMPVLADISTEEDVFAATNTFPARPTAGEGPRRHTRLVRYRRGEAWIVLDEVIAFGPTKVSARWLFDPERVVEADAHELRTVDTEGANLRLVPLGDVPWALDLYRGQGEPFEAGWQSKQFTMREPATQAIYSAQINQPTLFGWIIAPADADWSALLAHDWLAETPRPLANAIPPAH